MTEAGRQGVPLGEEMAMTGHRGVSTVMGYLQVGTLLESRATTLLKSSLVSEEDTPEALHVATNECPEITSYPTRVMTYIRNARCCVWA